MQEIKVKCFELILKKFKKRYYNLTRIEKKKNLNVLKK